MMILFHCKRRTLPFACMVLLFLSGGTMPGFSQEIIATFGGGGLKLDHTEEVAGAVAGGLLGMNVLFVGRSGFAVSGGIDAGFNFEDGISVDPVLGLGYVYYDAFYVGGILNFIPKFWTRAHDNPNVHGSSADMFIAPTLVAGFDFRSFVLGAQVSYIHGSYSSVSGFRVLIGAGVNVGRSY